MSLIHRSPDGSAFYDQRGFVEIVFREHAEITVGSFERIFKAMEAAGHRALRLLISRINEYGLLTEFNVADFAHIGAVKLDKVAIYAPTAGDQNLSHVLRITALRHVPCRIFLDREPAIFWLLEKPEPGDDTTS